VAPGRQLLAALVVGPNPTPTPWRRPSPPLPPLLPPQVTPFLLERIRATTGGASLQANIALVKHNAAVGSAIARELAALEASPAAGR
jgi:hypothetical protein